MSESDTMFNMRDRRCAAVQLMLSTNPSYNNRTIVSTIKMQFRTVQHLRSQLNASDDPSEGYGYGLWCGFKWGPHHATSHLRSLLEIQHQRVPGCADECGDTLVQSGGRWQTLGVAAGIGAGPQVKRYPGLASEGVLRLAPLLPDLNLLDNFVWSYVDNITNMTSHNTKASLIAAIRRVFAELPPALVKKYMFPIPDPYRGGDWGWRRLHWIDVSSTT